MWRTGSSYLLSRFAAEQRYLTFYEPFNGELSSSLLRARATASYAERHRQLRHPGNGEGYFSLFDRQDPKTKRPLWSFSHPRLPLFDVYNGLSARGVALLHACQRLAEAEGKTAVFGFCHSGLQVDAMRAALGGTHIYLYRDPVDQFVSYQPTRNDFFGPATVAQLLAARDWAEVAVQLVPVLSKFSTPLTPFLVRTAPHRVTMNLARRASSNLTLPDLYKLFYLSWQLSNGAPRQGCDESVSLHELQSNLPTRADFEARHHVQLIELSYPRTSHDLFNMFDRVACEAEVEAAVRERSSRLPALLSQGS
jgi:hypothetical protein